MVELCGDGERDTVRAILVAALLTLSGCAVAPVLDYPCAFHEDNPGVYRIEAQLFDMCMNGEQVACDLFNDLHEVRDGEY